MKTSNLLESYPDFFVSEIREDTLWLKFSGNFFHNIIDFGRTGFLSDYFGRISNDPDIKSLVIHSSYHESGSDEYMHFFLFECPERHAGFSNSMSRYELHRFCNIIDRLILDIVRMDKMIINICRGNVLSLFLNISFACDYRIFSSDTVFYNVFQEIGMLPKGGSSFFLNRMIGASKAKELLLLSEKITAEQAHQYGIANQLVSPEKLEDEAMQVAQRFSQVPQRTLAGVKRLTNYSIGELKEYLEFETKNITIIGNNVRFDDQ